MKRLSRNETCLTLLNVVLLVANTSCTRKQSEFEKILFDKQKCWTNYDCSREQIDTAKMRPMGCTVFYENGDSQVMSMSGNKDKPLELFIIDGGSQSAEGWSFNAEDSTFKVEDDPYHQYKVTFFCADTISLKKANGEINTLVNMK